MTTNAHTQADAAVKPFRVLSLDGGGAKGVYTLGVLKEVEAIANAPLCEVFDLIFGTSSGSIIASLIALGRRIEEIENLYFSLVPKVMKNYSSRSRTNALKIEAENIFGQQDFSAFKIPIGIVCANYDFERPMVFKNSVQQAHGRAATFKPGFGCTIAEAVVASCAAYPFFKKDASEIVVLSVGVGSYNEPKRSLFHQIIFKYWAHRHIAKMFNINSTTIDQLRIVLFPHIPCVRVSESYPQPEYATDLLESDLQKLQTLNSLGRESFAKYERDIRTTLKI